MSNIFHILSFYACEGLRTESHISFHRGLVVLSLPLKYPFIATVMFHAILCVSLMMLMNYQFAMHLFLLISTSCSFSFYARCLLSYPRISDNPFHAVVSSNSCVLSLHISYPISAYGWVQRSYPIVSAFTLLAFSLADASPRDTIQYRPRACPKAQQRRQPVSSHAAPLCEGDVVSQAVL